MSKKLILFTFRDFSKYGGGLIRIKGILNSISYILDDVILISNISDINKKALNNNIKHIEIGIAFSVFEKRFFQLCLSFFPVGLVNFIFLNKINRLKKLCKNNNLNCEEIVFCEYLDISIGYLLKRNKFIKNYICDVHGLAPNEFMQKKDNKMLNYFKYRSSVLLDRKVFSNSNGIIFASQAMKKYFYAAFPKIKNKKHIILPYYLSKDTCEWQVNLDLLNEIKVKYKIKDNDKVVFFAGGFKSLGGVTDLVKAFIKSFRKINNLKLFLIGEGEEMNNVKNIIKESNLKENVILVDKIKYSDLRTYQELANIIVCPDRENIFSNLVIHLKYIDSLVSNKIVINGSFDSVKEININNKLSIDFIPSNINDLSKKIIYAIENYDKLIKFYSKNNEFVKENLVYEKNVIAFLDLIEDFV